MSMQNEIDKIIAKKNLQDIYAKHWEPLQEKSNDSFGFYTVDTDANTYTQIKDIEIDTPYENAKRKLSKIGIYILTMIVKLLIFLKIAETKEDTSEK